MRTQARLFIVGGATLALGLALLVSAETGRAADQDKTTAAVLKVADQLRQKNDAKETAKAVAKDNELEEVMGLLKLRSKKGLGVGTKAGAVKPDGIEAILLNLEKRVPKDLVGEHAADMERAAYVAAAIAQIASHQCPVKKKEKDKDPKQWQEWCEDMHKSALKLADAFKAKNAAEVKKAAKELNNSCTNCHGVFRQ